MSDTKIEIKTNPTIRPLRIILSSACVLAVIGVGIATGSAAMQWAGFVLLFLTLVGYVASKEKENKGLSIAEARKILDEIEKKEQLRVIRSCFM